jgi:hypothetical protein
MSLHSWLRNVISVCTRAFGPRSRALSRRDRNPARLAHLHFRPSVEGLEQRWAPAVFNNASQWSPTHNPGRIWSYGYLAPSSTPETPDTSTFTLWTQEKSVSGDFGGHIELWYSDLGNVSYNPESFVVNVGTVTFQPHQAGFHPGPDGEYSDYRFTAPNAKTYSLTATFTSIDTVGGADKDIHVLVNGSELYDDSLSGSYGSTKTFSSPVTLAKGDQVDFVVGFGLGPYFNDTTGLDATLTTGGKTFGTATDAASRSLTDTGLLDASRMLSLSGFNWGSGGTLDAPANIMALPKPVPDASAVSSSLPAFNMATNGVPAAAIGAATADAVFGDLSTPVVSEPLVAMGPTLLQ